MALRFVSVLLCTIFVIATALALPPPPPSGKCAQNAERQTCGSACAPTCAKPNPGPTCVLPCVDGCFCKAGYLKAANGVCVRPEECDSVPHIPNMQIPQFNAPVVDPPKCGVDEEYRTCGSACIPTCAMPLPKPWCTRHCSVGCYCKEGYLRNEQNVCIPATKCRSVGLGPINIPLHKVPIEESDPTVPFPVFEPGPVIIPSHKIPLGPGPVILPTPNVPFLPLGPGPVILPTPDVPFLPLGPGPVIFPASTLGPINIPLQRIPLTLPSPVCPTNEFYNTCGVQLDCLASCKMPMTPKCMERMCTPGCVCQKPYVRHPNGRCVEQTECPKN
jgi:hypothetical protein